MFCSHCREELPETAYFCLKCGVKSSKGEEDGVSYPWNWEKEVEKTLSTVASGVKGAFDTVKEGVRKSTNREAVFCSKCGEKNLYGSKFCNKCGKELA